MVKVFLQTYGCQMNVRDSEVIAGLLTAVGCQLTSSAEDTDVIIFNTCSVRQHAEDKVWSELGRIAKRHTHGAQRKTNGPIIGIVGCMAQNYKEQIFQRAPQVDFVVGPSDIHTIPNIIRKLSTNDQRPTTNILERKIWETDGTLRPEEIYHTGFYADKEHAYVVISEGCSNYCSYCVVPYVRGKIRHRPHKEILREIEEAVDRGIRKITLLGQNVNAYQHEGVDFVSIVNSVNSVKGLQEFSFITSHPKDTSIALFKAMNEVEKLRKCLHLPAQSGSDRILKLMNRGYSCKDYLDLAAKYRKIVKAGTLTTDFIVGFPTETSDDFEQTRSLAEEICFDAAFIFKYSARPHTPAASMPDDVPRKEKERRHKIILDLQKGISKKAKSRA